MYFYAAILTKNDLLFSTTGSYESIYSKKTLGPDPGFPEYTVRRSLVIVLLAPIYFCVMQSSYYYWNNFFCRSA